MSKKGLYSPAIRRVVTIILLIGITGTFLAIYYLVYLPQQRAEFNLHVFRMLHEMSTNFKEHVNNYGLVYSYGNKDGRDVSLPLSSLKKGVIDTSNGSFKVKDVKAFNSTFLASFKGSPPNVNNTTLTTQATIQQDLIKFSPGTATEKNKNRTPAKSSDTTISLRDILDPILLVHATEFESFLLIKQLPDTNTHKDSAGTRYNTILYKSEKTDIANIYTDSLFHNKYIEAPAIINLDIEGIAYKMFLLPFKLKPGDTETYVLAGIMTNEAYGSFIQSIPLTLLLSLAVLLVIVLLALPFLKVFFLSPDETITITDVRNIIVVIFIIPFFITLACSTTWLYLFRANWTTNVLQQIQNDVNRNFYNEIKSSYTQLKAYDSIIINAATVFDTGNKNRTVIPVTLKRKDIELKDIIFYPHTYKNFNSLHWMNDKGNDIAAWTLINRIPPTYFRVYDRDYFKDVRYYRSRVLPPAFDSTGKDSFSIQPVLSRLTGEYSINIATSSKDTLTTGNQDKIARVIGMSGKMYSVWNTVVPKGFAFCIIDESGKVVCHSDTARSLQENIMQESVDSLLIRNVINHKDSILLTDVDLYEQPVRMLIKPLQGLPYYLVTYYNKRGEYLFLLHITAFTFLCQSMLLLLASLFSYCMMMTDKRNTKLLFTPASLNWIRPSADKKSHYKKIILQCIASFTISALLVIIYYLINGRDESYYLFTVHAALLLPLFNITGYYTVKKSRDVIIKQAVTSHFLSKEQYQILLHASRYILLLYAVSLCLYLILQNVLFFNSACKNETDVIIAIFTLIVLVSIAILVIAGYNPDYKKNTPLLNESNMDSRNENNRKSYSYLQLFATALLLGVILMSVVPTIVFTCYAFRQEKTLQLQSFQVDQAIKIQQRRTSINQLYWRTKLNTIPFTDTAKAYINGLKFDTTKGIYLLNNEILRPVKNTDSVPPTNTTCSPFYKTITQFLFLPPDHDDFYDNSSHNKFYYWHLDESPGAIQLRLLYLNNTDNRDNISFQLTSTFPNTHLFSSTNANYSYFWQIVLLALILFIIFFYQLVTSVTGRIFLIGFFNPWGSQKKIPEREQKDPEWLQRRYSSISLQEACKNIFDVSAEVNFARIRNEENKALKKGYGEDVIIQLQLALEKVYEAIWNECTDSEKYTLYDFASDGFTNYKKVLLLYELYNRGLIVNEPDGSITLMTKSFRNFLITKQGAEEIKRMSDKGKKGSWGTLRTFFYVILIAMAIFIFISQEEASKRLITIITSLGALLPAILKLFDRSTFSTPATASKSDSRE